MQFILQFSIGPMGNSKYIERLFVEIRILLLQYVELFLVH